MREKGKVLLLYFGPGNDQGLPEYTKVKPNVVTEIRGEDYEAYNAILGKM